MIKPIITLRTSEVETVDFILDTDVEWSGDRTFFVIAMNVEVVVMTAIGEFVDKGWIAMEVEDDWLILSEEHVVLGIA